MKHAYARRLVCALCALALCAGLAVPALAAEEPAYDVTWEALEEHVLSNSLNAQALQESIESIQSLNYPAMQDQLRDQINGLAQMEWYYSMASDNASARTAKQTRELLKDQFEAIRDGDMQKDNADVVRQIENGSRQLVAGAQSLYLALIQMKDQLADIDRGLATLDRSLTELRLRQSLGQVPEQAVLNVEQTRSGIVSQRQSLESAISTYTIQLQILLGEEPTGELALAPVPQVTEEELAKLNYETDLAAAKEASWNLREAQITLDDAEETWKDAKKDHGYGSYQRNMADHTWAAAQLTYQAAEESFEVSFKALHDAIADKRQSLENKQAAVTYQQRLCSIAQQKYELGLISRFSLLAAQDDLEAARSEEKSARLALFTAWHNYQNAVNYGILN